MENLLFNLGLSSCESHKWSFFVAGAVVGYFGFAFD